MVGSQRRDRGWAEKAEASSLKDGKRSEIRELGPSLLVTMGIHGSKIFGSTGQSILTCQNMV